MKKLIVFAKWQWQKWELWQKWYVFAAFMLCLGWMGTGIFSSILLTLSIFVFVWIIVKWMIVDTIRKNWKQFNKERDDLFDKIKNSDKK